MLSCCFKKYFKFLSCKKALVNVLAFDGVIGGVGYKQGLSLKKLNQYIEKAFDTKNTKAVVLNINSPGGSPVQSELISKRITKLSNEKNIPVIAFVEDMAASGGYWLACAAPEIIVSDNSIVGSLGVIFSSFGFADAINKIGVERRVHTQGTSKALLDPFLPEKQEDVETIKRVQASIYENFKKHVSTSRKDKLKVADEILFSGSIWAGQEAVEIGVADKVNDMYTELKARFGDDVVIKVINEEKSWLKSKLNMVFEIFFDQLENKIFAKNKFELR